ncbi:MAG: (d)CMP kinase [Balneolales bacterium]|nr:(d)CMP kinase [Balneolales bacterium]
MIVTIDGPAGSGKSSTAKALSRNINWFYLDSGALYRTWTLLYLMGGGDEQAFKDVIDIHDVEMKVEGTDVFPVLNGEEVGNEIRAQHISENVSRVAAMDRVRERVNAEMRRLVKKHNFVADGRDLGSVVFPEADVKFFMTANLEERAQRRFREMHKAGQKADLDQIRDNIKDRDEADSSRATAPLIKPEGAINIDTTGLSFDEQVEKIEQILREKLNLS